jgi:hypothetical protein
MDIFILWRKEGLAFLKSDKRLDRYRWVNSNEAN